MAETRSFRWVVGRVADTGDALGTGGMRRADGTLAAQVRDLRYLGDDAGSKLVSQPSPQASPGRAMAQELAAQAVAVAVEVLLREVIIPGTAKLWRERVTPAINRKSAEWRARKGDPLKADAVEPIEVEIDKVAAVEQGRAIDTANDPVIELRRDEAEWRVAEAQRAYRELAEHLAVLRAARVVDDADMFALLAGRGQLEATEASAIESGVGEEFEVGQAHSGIQPAEELTATFSPEQMPLLSKENGTS